MPNGTGSSRGIPLPEAVRIPPELEAAAAARLLGDAGNARRTAGRRMVTAAALHGIDLSMMWGTLDRKAGRPSRVRQVCLAVPGAGRTAMLVLSKPAARREALADHLDRIASVQATCRGLAELNRSGATAIRLAQSLPEPADTWAVSALTEAGFVTVGELAYLRAPLRGKPSPRPQPSWPAGIEVRTVRDVSHGQPDRCALIAALDRSYVDTRDCPELCGLRETEDILESHRATGIFSPRLWWLLFLHGEPHGCMLLSHIPDHTCVELVYLGLSPQVRGQGLGLKLLEIGLAEARTLPVDHIACAVDLRNTPARRLYEEIGFREFGQRIALVKPIHGNDRSPNNC